MSNGEFAPPYVWDTEAGFLAFVVSPWSYDPNNIHCYPASFGGHTGGSSAAAATATATAAVSVVSAATDLAAAAEIEPADTCSPTQVNSRSELRAG